MFGEDFTSIEYTFLDKNGVDRDLDVTALPAIQQLKQHFDLEDEYRHLHSSSRVFTWNSADGSVSCRFDKFYVPGENFCNSSLCSIMHLLYSDHNAVPITEFAFE